MAKAAIIWTALLAAAIVLVVLAGINPPAEVDTVPVEQPEVVEQVEPLPIIIENKSPAVPERKSPVADIPENVAPSFTQLKPQITRFFVNEIEVPEWSESYYNFIPVKQFDIKSFAGSFGPYNADPRDWITVRLCSESYKIPGASPACQPVKLTYNNNYVSFAVGLTYDEYIGGMAAKDYIAYYTISSGDASLGESDKAVIRTVKD